MLFPSSGLKLRFWEFHDLYKAEKVQARGKLSVIYTHSKRLSYCLGARKRKPRKERMKENFFD